MDCTSESFHSYCKHKNVNSSDKEFRLVVFNPKIVQILIIIDKATKVTNSGGNRLKVLGTGNINIKLNNVDKEVNFVIQIHK